ncbi:MAG: maltotransferase domain-containing protein, partial [Acidimicrobiales bacterium]
MLGRLVIDNVHPATPNGYPAKVALDERVLVTADIFRDGHDLVAARLRWRRAGSRSWHDVA